MPYGWWNTLKYLHTGRQDNAVKTATSGRNTKHGRARGQEATNAWMVIRRSGFFQEMSGKTLGNGPLGFWGHGNVN